MMHRRLGSLVALAVVLGLALGAVLHSTLDAAQQLAVSRTLALPSDVFLRLIKMLIGPLVLATLTSSVAASGDTSALGRTSARALVWFLGSSLVALALGVAMVKLLHPGIHTQISASVNLPEAPRMGLSLETFVQEVVPRSVFEALANNEVLQIVVFSLFAGVGIAALGPTASPLLKGFNALAALMLKMTTYVMYTAPVAVFSALAATTTKSGLGIVTSLATFVAGFYLSLALLWILVFLAGYALLGRPVVTLLRCMRDPILIAFATASSEAAYGKTLAQLLCLRIPERVANLVLALGYSFNLMGSTIYCVFAFFFVAQAAGAQYSNWQTAAILVFLFLASKGVACVPRASLLVVAAALTRFGLPEESLPLLVGVDLFLDMGRTATNVLGNSIAAAIVAKWESASTVSRLREA